MTETEPPFVHWVLCSAGAVPPGEGWLGPRERERLASLRFEKRRDDWRLGRWAAKRVLAAVLSPDSAAGRVSTRPESIEIVAAEDGAPEAWVDGALAGVTVSISHRGGWALCAAGPAVLRLGCDLELIERRSQRFVEDYFTATEVAAMNLLAADFEASPGSDAVTEREETGSALAANLLWCAKESALKALREGLRRDTRSVEVEVGINAAGAGEWNDFLAHTGDVGPLRGRWRTAAPDLVLTIAADAPWSPRRVG